MEARLFRALLLTTVLVVSTGASYPTPNFIIETPDPALAKQFGDAAEKFRHEMAVQWTGQAMPNWYAPCTITCVVGPTLGAGGETSFAFDRGEVSGWRMTVQGSAERILDSVLPHEITHMVFASHFREPLPRWADEGGATTVEHISERDKYHKMLIRFLRGNQGIAFNRLFAMTEYPPGDPMPLYAHGYALADFLIQQGGHQKYLQFVGDGLDSDDWARAVEENYGYAGLGALQNAWVHWVGQGFPRIESPEQPAADPGMLASADRLARPQPNLVRHEGAAPVDRASYETPLTEDARERTPAREPTDRDPRGPSLRWHASETTPAARAEASTETPDAVALAEARFEAALNAAEPVRTQTSRPQPVQQARQIILEWNRP